MDFNGLYNLILEGSGDPLYDIDPNTLTEVEINNLKPDVARELSKRDNSIRRFTIKTDKEELDTMAKSKNEAIGNIGYRLANAAKRKPNLVIYKMNQNGVKVFDSKWKVKY